MNDKPLTQLTDAELITLARNPETPDHISRAAFDEGLARLEKASKKAHPKDCFCTECQQGDPE